MKELNQKSFVYKTLWISLIVFAIGASISISLEELGAFIAIVSFGILLAMKQLKLKNSIIDISILLITIGYISSSLIVSPEKIHSLQANLSDLWMIPLFYVIVFSLSIKQYKKILKILLWVSLFTAFYGIWESFTGIDFIKHRVLTRWDKLYFASGFWGLHLTYGGFMAMISVVAFGFALDMKSIKEKFFYHGIALFTLLASIFSFSRSAIVGVFAGLFFFFIVNIKKTYKITIIVLVILVLVFSFSHSLQDRMHGTFNPNYIHKIWRFQIWVTALNMIKDHPIFGVGANNFSKLYNKYKEPSFDKPPMPHAHNDILNSYLLGGISGVIGYLLLFFFLIFFGLWSLKNSYSFLMIGLIASVVVMFFQGLSQCYFVDAENSWLFWFFSAGIWLYVLENKKHYDVMNHGIDVASEE